MSNDAMQSQLSELLKDNVTVEDLYGKLGQISKAQVEDYKVASAIRFEPAGPQSDEVLQYFQGLGERIFQRLSREVYALFCGKDEGKDREELLKAFGLGELALAAALTPILISNFLVSPVAAPILAALVIKYVAKPIAEPIYEDFCDAWRSKLPVDPATPAP